MVLERFDENLSFFKFKDDFDASCYSKFQDFENLYNLVTINKGSCDDTPYVGKAKTNFRLRFNNYKSKHQFFQRGKGSVPRKRFHSHYIQDCERDIDDCKVNLFEKCETHKQHKERETFFATQIKKNWATWPKWKRIIFIFITQTVRKIVAFI